MPEGRSPPRHLAPDPVESATRQPTVRRGSADQANADKRPRGWDLYRCLNVALLLDGWGDLNKDAASGGEGGTWHAYGEHRPANGEALVERWQQTRERATRSRRRSVPKGTGQDRP